MNKKKFVFLSIGYTEPTKEIMDAWMAWFKKIEKYVVDRGNPFAPGKEITSSGIKDLPLDKGAITGYTIIEAKDMDEAVKIAKDCPIITSLRVYEAVEM